MKLHVGTSGFSYDAWKGSFYPERLPKHKMLAHYAEHLGTVEINSTFMGMPAASVLAGWARQVPESFRFVLKAPRRITHILKLQEAEQALQNLLEGAAALGARLGPLLFQLPPYLKKDVARLEAFIGLLPAPSAAAFEFRHASWFDDEVFALLRAHRAALCIAEAETDLEVPFVATTDWGYLRLRRPDYSDAELVDWLERMRSSGWREAFVFFKHEGEGRGPRLAQRLLGLAG